MYLNRFIPGDRLLVMKDVVIDNAITHSGTYMGNGLVAHLNPAKGLVVEPVEQFTGGQNPKVISNGHIAEDVLWDRFNQVKDKSSYQLLFNNCEHLSNFLETGHAFSKQATYGVTGFITGCAVVKMGKIRNPWVALGLIGLTSIVGAKMGAPKSEKLLLDQTC